MDTATHSPPQPLTSTCAVSTGPNTSPRCTSNAQTPSFLIPSPAIYHHLAIIQSPAKKTGSKKNVAKFVLDCWRPIGDEVMDTADFEKFLHDKIKVDGKPGNLGSKVTISSDKTKLTVFAELPFSKRYLKWLAKKYLKRNQLKDFLRVVATKKDTYELQYYKVENDKTE